MDGRLPPPTIPQQGTIVGGTVIQPPGEYIGGDSTRGPTVLDPIVNVNANSPNTGKIPVAGIGTFKG